MEMHWEKEGIQLPLGSKTWTIREGKTGWDWKLGPGDLAPQESPRGYGLMCYPGFGPARLWWRFVPKPPNPNKWGRQHWVYLRESGSAKLHSFHFCSLLIRKDAEIQRNLILNQWQQQSKTLSFLNSFSSMMIKTRIHLYWELTMCQHCVKYFMDHLI